MKYNLPKPLDDDLFEDMVCDIYSRIFSNPNLQRFGRRGQRQHGIDIIGKNYNNNQLQALQCKCHTVDILDNDIIKELDDDLSKFDASGITVENYIFVTSTPNSKGVQKHVIEINSKRSQNKQCNVEVIFWEFLQKAILETPDLLSRYFFRLLPNTKLEEYIVPDLGQKNRSSLELKWDEISDTNINSIQEQLINNIKVTLGEGAYDQTSEYILNLGFYSNNNNFKNIVDLDIDFKSLFAEEENAENRLQQLISTLNDVCNIIQADKRISKQIVIYLDIEVSFAFLLGIILRKRKFIPTFIFRNQAWTVDKTFLNYIPSEIKELKPEIRNLEGKEIVFVYACTPTFDFNSEKDKFNDLIEKLNPNIKFLFGFNSSQIKNSAHALSISTDIATKLNSLSTWGDIEKVHLILITPKAIASLIGYQLNTLNIKVIPYFLNQDRKSYLSVGEINNNLLR